MVYSFEVQEENMQRSKRTEQEAGALTTRVHYSAQGQDLGMRSLPVCPAIHGKPSLHASELIFGNVSLILALTESPFSSAI